jgi:hypothetical protein
MNILITKEQLKVLIEQEMTPQEQLDKFELYEDKIKSLFMGKKNVQKWKEHLESKYPSLVFRFQIGNDVLIAQAKIRPNL